MLVLRSLGSFHLGGSVAHLSGMKEVQLTPVPGSAAVKLESDGAFSFGQMYVQFARLQDPRSEYPLLLWHGGGLTGACWESTPDGRAGWQSRFLHRGLDIFTCDAVERGRSGWARFPQIYPDEPVFMPQHAAWQLYRVGPASGYNGQPQERRVFPGSQFPVMAFEAFARQIVPRWVCNDALIQAAYDELVAREGPCLLLAHSQGAGFALRAACAAPGQIRAMILVEPGGVPLGDDDVKALASVPVLIVWGDFVGAVPFWIRAREQSDDLASSLVRHGGNVSVLDLPAQGITGNSHLLMMDENSDVVADRIADWLEQIGCLGPAQSGGRDRHHSGEKQQPLAVRIAEDPFKP